MSNTLVINPLTPTTALLKRIYEGKGYDVIEDPCVSDDDIVKAIKSHDRIIMLGYGCSVGLYSIVDGEQKLIIDDSHASLLQNKKTYSVWSNSFEYFKKHGMTGFHTGRIISDENEAKEMGIEGITTEEIQKGLIPLIDALRDTIEFEDLEVMRRYVFEHYTSQGEMHDLNRGGLIIL